MKALILTISLAIIACPSSAEVSKRPFWTEKSSFIEGEDLFVVGIASNSKTVEEGRKQAFENGKVELMNFAQVTNVEAKGLVIETQMTFEDPHPNGTVTVYRLLRVSAARLVSIQGRLQEQTRVQEQALDKEQKDLQLLQQVVARKQESLERQSRHVQETLDSVSRLQETLGQKAIKIEQTQKEVEQLLQHLSTKIRQNERAAHASPASTSPAVNGGTKNATSPAEPLLGRLKETEAKLDAQEAELRALAKRAKDRLAKEEEMARAIEKKCRYVEPGMTIEEVNRIMPEHSESHSRGGYGSNGFIYSYKYMNKKGATETISVGFAFNELVDSLDGCPGKQISRP
jgi:DNA repair exonuclease SbcCD ATPase subunit